MAYLSFQTIFFERFIACFKIRGNVGFFIITIDFVGYLGTLALLLFKEFYASHIDWQSFYNHMSFWIGIVCCIAFMGSFVYMIQAKKRKQSIDLSNNVSDETESIEIENSKKENNIYFNTSVNFYRKIKS